MLFKKQTVFWLAIFYCMYIVCTCACILYCVNLILVTGMYCAYKDNDIFFGTKKIMTFFTHKRGHYPSKMKKQVKRNK
jgi:hypothetical protein